MESVYVVGLWLLGLILIAIGWYVPGAGAVAWLGAVTLLFGALIAFRNRV